MMDCRLPSPSARRAVRLLPRTMPVLCALLMGCSELHLHFFERSKDTAPPEVEVIIQPSDKEPETEIILPSKTKPKKSAKRMKRAYAGLVAVE